MRSRNKVKDMSRRFERMPQRKQMKQKVNCRKKPSYVTYSIILFIVFMFFLNFTWSNQPNQLNLFSVIDSQFSVILVIPYC